MSRCFLFVGLLVLAACAPGDSSPKRGPLTVQITGPANAGADVYLVLHDETGAVEDWLVANDSGDTVLEVDRGAWLTAVTRGETSFHAVTYMNVVPFSELHVDFPAPIDYGAPVVGTIEVAAASDPGEDAGIDFGCFYYQGPLDYSMPTAFGVPDFCGDPVDVIASTSDPVTGVATRTAHAFDVPVGSSVTLTEWADTRSIRVSLADAPMDLQAYDIISMYLRGRSPFLMRYPGGDGFPLSPGSEAHAFFRVAEGFPNTFHYFFNLFPLSTDAVPRGFYVGGNRTDPVESFTIELASLLPPVIDSVSVDLSDRPTLGLEWTGSSKADGIVFSLDLDGDLSLTPADDVERLLWHVVAPPDTRSVRLPDLPDEFATPVFTGSFEGDLNVRADAIDSISNYADYLNTHDYFGYYGNAGQVQTASAWFEVDVVHANAQ